MNMLDSELVVAALRKDGYELVDNPARADTILFNTCSVRQHAEDKIYSALGRLKHAKEKHPHKVIGVLGCMAQNHQRLVFERAPYVDLVVGPGQLHQVPRLLSRNRRGQRAADGSKPRSQRPAAAKRSNAASRATIPTAIRRCARRRTKHSCASRSAAINFAPTASSRPSAGRSRGAIRGIFWPKPANWPTKAAAKSRCWARP